MIIKTKHLIFLFIFMSVLCRLYPQGGWHWQNPLPTGNNYYAIQFIDSLNGWISSTGGSVLHTDDGGITWEVQWTGSQAFLRDLVFVNPDTGWVVGRDGGQSIILYTNNGGYTWSQQEHPLDSIGLALMAVDFIDHNRGWVTASSHIFQTVDGGNNWIVHSYPVLVSEVQDINFLNSNDGWVIGANKVLRTHNGGSDWEEIDMGNIIQPTFWRDVMFLDSLEGWMVGGANIIHTVNGGDDWEVLLDSSDFGFLDVFFMDSLKGWALSDIGLLWFTDDGGINWQSNEITVSVGVSTFSIVNDSIIWVAGYNQNIFLSEDGGSTWRDLSSNVVNPWYTYFLSVDFINQYQGWIAGSNGVILHTSDGGNLWYQQSGNTTERLRGVKFVNSLTGWIVGDEGSILFTNDEGAQWANQTSGVTVRLNAIDFVDEENGWIAGGDYFEESVILHTSNGGITWDIQLNQNIPVLNDIDFVDSLHGWAVGNGNIILSTVDGGINWTTWAGNNYISDFYSVSFVDSLTGWVVGTTGPVYPMYKTVDGGITWSTVHESICCIDDMQFISAEEGWMAGYGVYHTIDGGYTWKRQATTTSNGFWSISFIDSEIGWVVGDRATIMHTTSGGMLYINSSGNNPTIVPSKFIVSQNYPNPFNPITTIHYELPKRSDVQITIFDLLGRRVTTLVNQTQDAGFKSITWNATNDQDRPVSAGIYFYQIHAGEFMQTEKMVLLR